MVYQKMRLRLLSVLSCIPLMRSWAERRLPRHERGYKYYWEDSGSLAYREDMYRRQRDMDANPTFDEMRAAIAAYSPSSVLNVGCGYGRELEALAPFFSIEGCDIAEDLLAKARGDLSVFRFDIVEDSTDRRWDILFCRAVMMYFAEPDIMRKAMRNMESMAVKRVIVWEWPHVCRFMQETYPSEKFEYHPMSYNEQE
jgi:trans-aconitate methyltransferase